MAAHCYPAVRSTGALVALPPPVFSRVAEGEGDADADDDDPEGEGADQPEGEANEGGEDAAKPASASAAAAAGASKAKSSGGNKGGQRSHEGPKPVRVLAFHPDPATPWLLFNTEEKYIHLYHMHKEYESGFKHILTVSVDTRKQTQSQQTAAAPATAQLIRPGRQASHPPLSLPPSLPPC